jgi:hypothetical protein
MNKREFCTILQCSLLAYEGVSQNEMILKYGLDPKLAKIGSKLCSFLKRKKVENVK